MAKTTYKDFNNRVLAELKRAHEAGEAPMSRTQIAKALYLSTHMADRCLTELRKWDRIHVAFLAERTNTQMFAYGKRPAFYRLPVAIAPVAPRDSVMCALMGIAA